MSSKQNPLITEAKAQAIRRADRERRGMGVFLHDGRAYVRPLNDLADSDLIPGGLDPIPLECMVLAVHWEPEA